MTMHGRGCLVPAVNGFRASPASYYGTSAAGSGVAGGPAGSTSMTFFAVCKAFSIATATGAIFGRSNFSTAGWQLSVTGTGATARAYNSTPAIVAVTATAAAFDGDDTPALLLASYQLGVITFWINGALVGTAGPVGGNTGFTPFVNPTCIGSAASTPGTYPTRTPVGDCGMLDTYDAASFVSALYGNGGPGLSAMWLDDMRQGRYLTWPRAAVANSDWYWAAADVLDGPTVRATWTDRGTAQAMTRFGSPQGASFPARL